MRGIQLLSLSAVMALLVAANAWAGPDQCAASAGEAQAQCASLPGGSPRDTQLAADYYLERIVNERNLGCTATPCTDGGGRDYPCTYHYTATVKACSMCCTLDAQQGPGR